MNVRANFETVDDRLRGPASAWFDLVRGLAAVTVVHNHLSTRLMVGYGDVEGGVAAPMQLFYLSTLLGPAAVMIFFVLSGLFVGRSVSRQMLAGRFGWGSFMTDRLTRLWIVLVPAFALTAGCALLAERVAGVPADDLGLRSLLGNLFFTQTILVDAYGGNGPLWSLANEFWYYLAFPLCLGLLLWRGWRRAVAAAAIIAIGAFVGGSISAYFAIWLAGAIVLFLPGDRLAGRWWAAVGAIGTLGMVALQPMLAFGRIGPGLEGLALFPVDLALGLAFGLYVHAMIHGGAPTLPDWTSRVARWLAGFSFSLYVIHFPILTAAFAVAETRGFAPLQPGIGPIALEGMLIVLLCLVAWAFASLTEAHTYRLRKWLGTRRREPEPLLPVP